MKRNPIFVMMLMMILFSVNEKPQEKGDMIIHVLLSNPVEDSYYYPNVILSSKNGFIIKINGDRESFSSEKDLDLDKKMSVGDKVTVYPSNQQAQIEIKSDDEKRRDPYYEGSLEICRMEEGFTIVNVIPLETYLKYVVPSEMPASYPLEALKAQAVCARTYAIRQMKEGRYKEWNADVDDTVACQVYHMIGRQEKTDEAVEATRGLILACKSEPIQAYFFSTSWGYTSSDQVWDGDNHEDYLCCKSLNSGTIETSAVKEKTFSETKFEELIRKEDPKDLEKEEAWYRWHVSIPWEKLEERFLNYGENLGRLQNLYIIQRSDGGAVIRLRLEGTSGEMILTDEYQIRKFLAPGEETVIRKDGKEISGLQLLPSAYFSGIHQKDENGRSEYVMAGGGYGHGVGMSQNGAKALANKGETYKEILFYFYQNVEMISMGTEK